MLVLGKEKDFDGPLSSLGKVAAIDITIPKPAEKEVVAATPESNARGKALLAATRKAMGGDALLAVKDYTMTFDMTAITPQGEFALKGEGSVNLAGKILLKMTTPMGEVVQAFDGQSAWMRTPQGTQDAPASARGQLESNIYGGLQAIVQRYDAQGVEVQALGASGGLEGVAFSDAAHNVRVKLFVDPKTGLVAKKAVTGGAMAAPGEVEESYDDYRDVNGIKWPFHSVTTQGGKKVTEQKVNAVKVNPGLPDSAYKKP